MTTLNDFCDWLKENTVLSDASIEHYERGFRAASKDLLEWNVISKPLSEMTLAEYEVALFLAFENSEFQTKNKVGGRMYSNSLKHYASFLKMDSSETVVTDKLTEAVENEQSLSQTEKTAIIKSRIGQGLFRKKLLAKYEGRCIITGIAEPKLLIASHIKPWSVSSNENRLSAENGLLLNSLYDKMFDLGLITFSENGKIMVSRELKKETVTQIGIKTDFAYSLKASPLLLENMEYHRDVVFLKG